MAHHEMASQPVAHFERALDVYQAAGRSLAQIGVSLTLVGVEDERFSVALIPHTLAATTLGQMKAGGKANLETDVLAKYVSRWRTHSA